MNPRLKKTLISALGALFLGAAFIPAFAPAKEALFSIAGLLLGKELLPQSHPGPS